MLFEIVVQEYRERIEDCDRTFIRIDVLLKLCFKNIMLGDILFLHWVYILATTYIVCLTYIHIFQMLPIMSYYINSLFLGVGENIQTAVVEKFV